MGFFFFNKITYHKHPKSRAHGLLSKPHPPGDGFYCSKQTDSKDWKGLSFITHSKTRSGLAFFPQRVRKHRCSDACAPQQPSLPFCRQASQKTWPQLVRWKRAVGLRGSHRQELQNTAKAMEQRGRAAERRPEPGTARGPQAEPRPRRVPPAEAA